MSSSRRGRAGASIRASQRPAGPRRPAGRRQSRLGSPRAARLFASLGYTLIYLSVLVLIPLAACFAKALTLSPAAVLGRGLDAAGGCRLQVERGRFAGGRGGQRGAGPVDCLGLVALSSFR